MAVPSNIAFGHYLRTLRERRSLSLDEVWSLSQTFPEPLNKGYLSRCENGKQKLALPKVIALSRIYEIPTDALVERLELDLELERFGGPPTEGLSVTKLKAAATNAIDHGHYWAAYAFMRDVTIKIQDAPLDSARYATIDEQSVSAFMNAASIARALGKYQYALHELLFGEHSGSLGQDSSTLSAQRLAQTFCRTRQFEKAKFYANIALERLPDSNGEYEPYVLEVFGVLEALQSNFVEATQWFQKSYESAQRLGLTKPSAIVLLNIADTYKDAGNRRAAKRTVKVLLKLAEEQGLSRHSALGWTLLALLLADEDREQEAQAYLEKASSVAKELNDKVLRFQVEFFKYKHALEHGRLPAARAAARRLRRLASSVPDTNLQLAQFKILQDTTRQQMSCDDTTSD